MLNTDSTWHKYAVNCSVIFGEFPLLERPGAAANAGFDAVEFWWPFASPEPSRSEITEFEHAVLDSGVKLIALNFFAGNLGSSDCGMASIPNRVNDFNASVAIAVDIGRVLDVHRFNALYGNRVAGVPSELQDQIGLESLSTAARAVAEIGGTVMIEPISGPKPYPLRTATDVLTVINRVREKAKVGNVGLLADFYHLTVNGDDVKRIIDQHVDDIVHVQIADVPGRHQPGTGSLNLDGHLHRLRQVGYTGWIGLEYIPTGTSADSFNWLPIEARGWRP